MSIWEDMVRGTPLPLPLRTAKRLGGRLDGEIVKKPLKMEIAPKRAEAPASSTYVPSADVPSSTLDDSMWDIVKKDEHRKRRGKPGALLSLADKYYYDNYGGGSLEITKNPVPSGIWGEAMGINKGGNIVTQPGALRHEIGHSVQVQSPQGDSLMAMLDALEPYYEKDIRDRWGDFYVDLKGAEDEQLAETYENGSQIFDSKYYADMPKAMEDAANGKYRDYSGQMLYDNAVRYSLPPTMDTWRYMEDLARQVWGQYWSNQFPTDWSSNKKLKDIPKPYFEIKNPKEWVKEKREPSLTEIMFGVEGDVFDFGDDGGNDNIIR